MANKFNGILWSKDNNYDYRLFHRRWRLKTANMMPQAIYCCFILDTYFQTFRHDILSYLMSSLIYRQCQDWLYHAEIYLEYRHLHVSCWRRATEHHRASHFKANSHIIEFPMKIHYIEARRSPRLMIVDNTLIDFPVLKGHEHRDY